jgi:formamidopyrimidine-DNA glycosylase
MRKNEESSSFSASIFFNSTTFTMPELPEVERFRRLLLPLVSDTMTLKLTRLNTGTTKPPRKFISDDEISEIHEHGYRVASVNRKGKLICLVLTNSTTDIKYCYVHMGMTGRISTPYHVPKLESLRSDVEYPPPYSHLKFSVDKTEACFSDPRKFGSIQIKSDLTNFESMAPDALNELQEHKEDLLGKIVGQSMGIKGILLDQKRVVSGVGNWIADELMYQMQMHPDQNYLTKKQATTLLDVMHNILTIAVECEDNTYPKGWLFHYRWNKKKNTKDAQGRTITFLTSGGRTSAIVPSLQTKKSQVPTTERSRNDKPKKRRAANKEKVKVSKEDKKTAASSSNGVGTKITSNNNKRRKKVKDETSSTTRDERSKKNERRSPRLRNN